MPLAEMFRVNGYGTLQVLHLFMDNGTLPNFRGLFGATLPSYLHEKHLR